MSASDNHEKTPYDLKKTKRIKKMKQSSLIDQIVSLQNEDKINKRVLPGNYLECFPFPKFRLNKKKPFYIGRSKENDLVLASTDVSRKHALVKWNSEERAYIIYDLESANGIYVNAQQCQRRVLEDKDIILIGEHHISYFTIKELQEPKEMEGAETTIMKQRNKIVEKLYASLKGNLEVLDLGTVLQMIASEKKTGYIKIDSESRGYIQFENGYVVHCEVGEEKGEEAFFAIMEWKSGNFNFVKDVKPTERTMNDEVQYLLMEVAHREDEQQRGEMM
ncbi:DUF4388 domain-containing protein [Candidatus Uabimicrobium amorphum]|uniref:PATAN domain GTPase-activating protein n=1 Tax=Uabimicrobium amorphum TaxID=2596890 RepID=A0A5S9IN67_UABAM|nr:DUF4388 domain-containing protein [Candidatus Uabimicrobium amorphum]BBM83635.1 PATAN domain GTPase-activating protein [Candidatus Uabimicrobium amorphum]